MEIFDLKNNKVIIHPAAYVLKPFKDIWEADKTKNKTKALKELAFVYYYSDYKSDFSDILNDEEKINEIKKIVELTNDWKPSAMVKKAISFYKERQKTPSMHLLDSALAFTEELKNFYETVNLKETDKNGKPIWNIAQLQKGVGELANQTESLKKLKDAVAREIAEGSRIRGGLELGIYEDPE